MRIRRPASALTALTATAAMLLTACGSSSDTHDNAQDRTPKSSVQPTSAAPNQATGDEPDAAIKNDTEFYNGPDRVTDTQVISDRDSSVEISFNSKNQIVMVRFTRGYNDHTTGRNLAIVGSDGTFTTCNPNRTGCTYSKPLNWSEAYVQDISGRGNAIVNQSNWPALDTMTGLSEFRERKNFTFIGESATFKVELDKQWRVLSITPLMVRKDSMLSMRNGEQNRTYSCGAGQSCIYFRHPVVFKEIVETNSTGLGRSMTLPQIKKLPTNN